jgi:histidinol-phosphate aminotransferase
VNISGETDRFVRSDIKSLVGFEYNKSPDLLKDRIPEAEIIKLNGNENPYGCSPRVNQALAEYKKYHVYPDSTQRAIRKSLAEYAGTTPDRIVVTGGGDQLLDVIVRLFIDAGDEAIICVPCYEVYRLHTQIAGGNVVRVLRNKDFTVNVNSVLKAITGKTKLVFLCNPNNPTGTIIPQADIIEVLKTGVPVIVDEAYFEFSRLTMLPYIEKYPNLMLLRTFSKWAAMAGFRLGYGIMSHRLADYLYLIKPPFSVSVPALVAFTASMEDKEHLFRTVQKIIDERERVYKEMNSWDSVKPYPSSGNFLFFDVLKGDAAKINQAMEDRGILIRHFNTPGLERGIRMTIGKPEQNDKVLATLKELLGE